MTDYKNSIRVIGFDLDQTLYEKSPHIDQEIQTYIYYKIADHRQCSLKEAEKLFDELYKDGKGLSGRRTLIELGVPNAADIVQDALENADIARYLTPNEVTINLLKQLRDAYDHIDLITGSNNELALKKLSALAIPHPIFSHILSGDTISKSDGKAYQHWLSLYPDYPPQAFLYIGDRPTSDCDVPKRYNINAILVNRPQQDGSIPCPQFKSLAAIAGVLL